MKIKPTPPAAKNVAAVCCRPGMGSEFALIIRSIVTIVDSLAIDDVLALFGSDKGQVVSSNKIRY